jgi:nucleoside-diphosphate-sugar epimerase
MSARKKVLVTGAGGFIGSHVCQYLSSQNYYVIGCYKHLPMRSLVNTEYSLLLPSPTLDTILAAEKPEFLVHCAGSASIIKSIENPENDFHQNVHTTESLLNSIQHYSPATKMIFLSSGAVYGNPFQIPIDENTPLKPISPYGYNKLSTEMLCEDYHRRYQLPITILRIFSVYGPQLRKQLLWDIYQKFLTEPIISLSGSGNETRDFIYIDDVVKIIEKAFHHSDFSANKVNIATGTSITIKQLAMHLLKALNTSKPLLFNNHNRPGDPKYWSVNVSHMKKWGITDFTPIDIGIKNYVTWLDRQGI